VKTPVWRHGSRDVQGPVIRLLGELKPLVVRAEITERISPALPGSLGICHSDGVPCARQDPDDGVPSGIVAGTGECRKIPALAETLLPECEKG